MDLQAYRVYVDTYCASVEVLQGHDEERLRALCSAVSRREGVESLVSILAMSDAERGLARRTRLDVLRTVIRRNA